MRQALVNNKFFSHLAVKHDLHKYMEYNNQSVFKELTKYLEFHEKNPPDVAYLSLPYENVFIRQVSLDSEINNYSLNLKFKNDNDDFEIEPPKFIADLFESVAGAIYLDSNGSLQTVWNVFYKIFCPYLSISFFFILNNWLLKWAQKLFSFKVAFKTNMPKSPIDELHKLRPSQKLKLDYVTIEDDGESSIEATLTIGKGNPEVFVGKGMSNSSAKKSAFKKAVRALSPNKNIIFFWVSIFVICFLKFIYLFICEMCKSCYDFV